jgi:hypothetical protein
MKTAEIKFLKVRANRQNIASDYYDYYRSASVNRVLGLFRVLFSTSARVLAQDAKQQLRLNSNNNNVQTRLAQCVSDADALPKYYDHSCNVVQKEGKLGLGTIVMLNTSSLRVQKHISA